MIRGVVDNSQKSLNPDKSIATLCMGSKENYDYLDENSAVEFRTIEYTNNPLIIAKNRRMTAINSALEVDLTGQADFMRGAALAPGGKNILALPSTAKDG